jgi:hypothetical protein
MGERGGLDLRKEYGDYLARFDTEHGAIDFGGFVKHAGRLVKKRRFEEFEPLFREYFEVARQYFDSLERGDTINDLVVKLLRERASELLLRPPV